MGRRGLAVRAVGTGAAGLAVRAVASACAASGAASSGARGESVADFDKKKSTAAPTIGQRPISKECECREKKPYFT